MGFFARLFGGRRRSAGDGGDEGWWVGSPFSAHATSGIQVNQQTALNATTVLAAVTMLCEDFAKLTPTIYRQMPNKARTVANDHELYPLLYEPNDYQNYFEWAEMMMFSLVLRGNAYSVKIRDGRGRVVKLIPVNADWVALWESPDGALFYRVTPNGLHLMAELYNQPFLIPAEDVLHVRGFSMNGLVGASRIVLAKDAIGLALGYERQAGQYMSEGANQSGVLTTDVKLTPEAAKRMTADWREMKGGLQNSGKIVVLEQGLKYQPTSLSAVDAQFIAARNLQIQEVTRIFRIPAHMIGDLARSTNNNITQLAQEYINLTMSSYTRRWAWKLDTAFGLRAQGLFVDYDLTQLVRADQTQRYNNYARGISGGFLKPNEARIDDGLDPDPKGDGLLQPANLAAMGSQSSGGPADGGGRPPEGSADQSIAPSPARKRKANAGDLIRGLFDPNQPRGADGKWTAGAAQVVTTTNPNTLKTTVHGIYQDSKDAEAKSDEVLRQQYAKLAAHENFGGADAEAEEAARPRDYPGAEQAAEVLEAYDKAPVEHHEVAITRVTPQDSLDKLSLVTHPRTDGKTDVVAAFDDGKAATAHATWLSQGFWDKNGASRASSADGPGELQDTADKWNATHADPRDHITILDGEAGFYKTAPDDRPRADQARLEDFEALAQSLYPIDGRHAYPGLKSANDYFETNDLGLPGGASGVFRVSNHKV